MRFRRALLDADDESIDSGVEIEAGDARDGTSSPPVGAGPVALRTGPAAGAGAGARTGRRSTVDSLFGTSDERIVSTIGPKPRQVRIPLWAVLLLAVFVVAASALASVEHQPFGWLERVCMGAAALCAALLAARLEERLFAAVRLFHFGARVSLPMVVAVAVLVGSALLVSVARAIPGAGDPIAVVLVTFAVWTASAAFGSTVMLVLDALLQKIVSEFRLRIVVAVFSLLVLAFAVCGTIAYQASGWALALGMSGEGLAEVGLLGFTLDDIPFIKLLLMQPSAFGFWALMAAAIVMLPAILSLCSKLAESVMERITPLMSAFDRVAEGERSVHLEEAGSSEFFSLALSFNEMVDKLYITERIERAFGQYVSPQVLSRIRAQRGAVYLPAQVRTASVFFADIRGFTTLSERLEPDKVVELLNRYLEEVVPVVETYHGFLNKFVGDAVVVVFNGPIAQADHAERATRCAIALQQRVTELNAQGAFADIGHLDIGIGVATGRMLCGNVGARSRLEYTVIGDTVNLAARMTGHALPGEVWVSEGTASMLTPQLPAVAYPPIKFKGKDCAVVPYAVWPPFTQGTYEPRGRS